MTPVAHKGHFNIPVGSYHQIDCCSYECVLV